MCVMQRNGLQNISFTEKMDSYKIPMWYFSDSSKTYLWNSGKCSFSEFHKFLKPQSLYIFNIGAAFWCYEPVFKL